MATAVVKQGVHFSFGREVITVERNGIPQEKLWDSDMPMETYLLDTLFDDMGIGKDDDLRSEKPEDKQLAREAAHNYFTAILQPPGELCLSMYEVKSQAFVFYDAYLAGMIGTTHPKRS